MPTLPSRYGITKTLNFFLLILVRTTTKNNLYEFHKKITVKTEWNLNESTERVGLKP